VLQFDLCDRRILAIKSNGLIILDLETGHAPKIRTIGYSQIWKKQQHRKAQEDSYLLHHRGSPSYGNCQLDPLWGVMLKLNLAIAKEVATGKGKIDIFFEYLSDHRTLLSRQQSHFSLRG
jgi:hypothetical protein